MDKSVDVAIIRASTSNLSALRKVSKVTKKHCDRKKTLNL